MTRIERNYFTIIEQVQFNSICISHASFNRIGISENRDTFLQAQDAQSNKKWYTSIKDFFVKILRSCLPCFFKKENTAPTASENSGPRITIPENSTIIALRETVTRAAHALRDAQAALAANPTAATLANAVLQAQNAAAAATAQYETAQRNEEAARAIVAPLRNRIDQLGATFAQHQAVILANTADVERFIWERLFNRLTRAISHFASAQNSSTPDPQGIQHIEQEIEEIEREARRRPNNDSFFTAWAPIREFLPQYFSHPDQRAYISASRETVTADLASDAANIALRNAQLDLAANPEAASLQQAVVNAQQALDEANAALQRAQNPAVV